MKHTTITLYNLQEESLLFPVVPCLSASIPIPTPPSAHHRSLAQANAAHYLCSGSHMPTPTTRPLLPHLKHVQRDIWI